MKKVISTALLMILLTIPSFSEESDKLIKETYKLQGQVEYNDNPIDVIYLDENIEKPQVNIPKRSLTLPVGVLNITSNTNSQRSALARASINRGNLKDILPLSGSVTEQIGAGFSYGQYWEQELSNYAQMEDTTAFFIRYDSPKRFSFTTSVRQATNQDIGTQYNLFRMTPELHFNDKLTLKDWLWRTNVKRTWRTQNETSYK